MLLVFLTVDVMLYYRYRGASSSAAPPAHSPRNATKWLIKRKPFSKSVQPPPPNVGEEHPDVLAAVQQALGRVASGATEEHAASHPSRFAALKKVSRECWGERPVRGWCVSCRVMLTFGKRRRTLLLKRGLRAVCRDVLCSRGAHGEAEMRALRLL
jgi:hypothetical protein